MAALGHALARLATTLADDRQAQRLRLRLGTLAAITAGGAADGSDAVTVTIGADTIPAPYLHPYSPTVADLVAVLLVNGAPLILGKVTGPPSL